MKALAVIPARFRSSRFPGKPLVEISGTPMVVRVARIAAVAVGVENVLVATEDERIRRVVEDAGFQAVITSDKCLTGTDRLAEVARLHAADVYLNVQGDEPMLDPQAIRQVLAAVTAKPETIFNAMAPLAFGEDPSNVNIPKVVATESGRLLYMSRAPVPGFKDVANRPSRYMKQVCVYAFSPAHLRAFSEFGRKSVLECSEDIEILRFLDLGFEVQMVEVESGSLAVDVPSDVALVEDAMRARGIE